MAAWRKIDDKLSDYTPTLRLDGYYKRDSLNEYSETRYLKNVIFYDDHYFATGYVPYAISRPKKYLRNKGILQWGRYTINRDSIFMQCYANTATPGSVIIIFFTETVQEAHGIILNDTTFAITSEIFVNGGYYLARPPGIHHIQHEKPIIYHFVRSDSLPPSDNWLKDRENVRAKKSKKK